MQDAKSTYRTKEQATFTELLEDQEAVLLDLDNLHYYTLNASAIAIWKLLRNGTAQTVDALAEQMASLGQVPTAQATRDTEVFLNQLHDNGLVTMQVDQVDDVQSSPASPRLPAPKVLTGYAAPRLQFAQSLAQVVLSGSSTIATAAVAMGGATGN